jgi:NAD+ diphosphatase
MKYFLDEPVASFQSTRELPEGDPILFAFVEQSLVLDAASGTVPTMSRATELGLTAETMPFGVLDGRPAVLATLPNAAALPAGLEAKSLRRLFGVLDLAWLSVAATGSQLSHFYATHRFCGSCAAPLIPSGRDRSLRCEACARDIYPPVSPCVIVLVHDEGRILLTRQPRFPKGMYGLVAGFVEPGETLETCAKREILEEVGLEITDLRYVGSQPWPFPSQLMIGMTARYAGGELRVDTEELEEARWFAVDALPVMPPPFSIARHLIDLHLAALAP